MPKIKKNDVEMDVSEKDFELIYKDTGWKIVGSADYADGNKHGEAKRITVDPNVETVAAPTRLVLEGQHEGETIVEDAASKPTKKGKDEQRAS